MPSIHFWGGFVGKEALLFTIMALFLYELNLNYFSWKIMVLFGAIFLIRPHVFFAMFAAFILVFILDKEQSLKNKYKIIIINVTVVAVLLPLTFIYFLKFEELDLVSFNSFLQDFITYTLNKGQTAINIKETSFLTRIGYNLFMPLPFLYPIYSLQLWWVALEGIYLLSVIIFYFFYLIRGQLSFYKLSKSSRYSLICGVLLLLLFSGYVYNLGLANRMRLMFYPYLFYGMLTSLKFLNEKKAH